MGPVWQLSVKEGGYNHSITASMARFNTHITLKSDSGDIDIEQHVVLSNIKRFVEYRVLAEHITRMVSGVSQSLGNGSH